MPGVVRPCQGPLLRGFFQSIPRLAGEKLSNPCVFGGRHTGRGAVDTRRRTAAAVRDGAVPSGTGRAGTDGVGPAARRHHRVRTARTTHARPAAVGAGTGLASAGGVGPPARRDDSVGTARTTHAGAAARRHRAVRAARAVEAGLTGTLGDGVAARPASAGDTRPAAGRRRARPWGRTAEAPALRSSGRGVRLGRIAGGPTSGWRW